MSDKNQDMSMDEILASIRKYVAEDGSPSSTAAAPAPEAKATKPVKEAPAKKIQKKSNKVRLTNPVQSKGYNPFKTLKEASEESPAAPETTPTGAASGQSLENLITLLAKPMVEDWINQNMERIVMDMVSAEIQKIKNR